MFNTFLFAGILVVTSASHHGPDRTKWFPSECSPDGRHAPNQHLTVQMKSCGVDPCHTYCEVDVLGLLIGKHELSSKSIYDEYVEVTFSSEYKEIARVHFDACFKKYRPHDEQLKTCEAVDAWGACLWQVRNLMPC